MFLFTDFSRLFIVGWEQVSQWWLKNLLNISGLRKIYLSITSSVLRFLKVSAARAAIMLTFECLITAASSAVVQLSPAKNATHHTYSYTYIKFVTEKLLCIIFLFTYFENWPGISEKAPLVSKNQFKSK